jgi:fibronectin-binding autotransporter adhesin
MVRGRSISIGVGLAPVRGLGIGNSHAFRYYRLYISASNGQTGVAFTELELAEYGSGPNTATGQTATASSTFAGFSASGAIDGNPADVAANAWASDFSATWPQWLKVDYGGTASNWKTINEIRITARGVGDQVQAPYTFIFQGSDDNSTWYDLLSQSSAVFGVSETRSFLATASGPSVSNELSGTSSLTFAPSATATGLGTLAGSAALTLSGSGAATGLGTLAGSSSVLLTPSGTATGLAALIGTTALTFTPSATATGLGSLTGSSTLVLAPSGTVTGLGSLLGNSPLTFAPAGTVSGLGTLAGTATLSLAESATVTGIGSLLASTALSFSLSGTVSTAGSNNIAGAAALTFSSSVTLQGLGQLQGAAQLSLTLSGVLTTRPRFVPDPHPANANFTPSTRPSETNVIGATRPGRVSITNA